MELLERENELTVLAEALAMAKAGNGRLLVIEGVAGNGKSALLATLSTRARAQGLRVLAARGGELERGFAFGTIRQLFEKLLTSAQSEERDRLLGGAAEAAATIVARSPGASDRVPSTFAVLHAIYWLSANLAAETPLLIVVDDLHWVDPSSVLALSYLARRVADLPIALAVALRPDEPGTPLEAIDGLRTEADAVTVSLGPLGGESVAMIVRDVIPAADQALCAACQQVTAGNPFYLRELLRTITLDRERAPDAAEVLEAAPPSVGDRVLRRIAELGAEAPPLARAMAVIDDGGHLSEAAALAGIDDSAAATVASAMRRIGILAQEEPFEFVHPLVRRSVYESLTATERDAAHLAAGRLMRARGASDEVVAAHFGLMRPAASTEVGEALLGAATEASARGAPQAARLALERALTENAPKPARALLLHRLGEVTALLRDPVALEHLSEALSVAEGSVERARIALDLSALLSFAGQWSAAVQLIGDAIVALDPSESALALRLEAVRTATMMYDPKLVDAFDRDWKRLRGLAQGESWGARALAALLAAERAMRGAHRTEVLALAEHALDDGSLIEDPGAAGWAVSQCLGALVTVDANRRATDVIEGVMAAARRGGVSTDAFYAVGFQAWIHVRAGELAAAEAAAAPVLTASIQDEVQMVATSGLYFLTDALIERTTMPELARALEDSALPPDFMATDSGAMLLDARGSVRAARGNRREAAADLRAAGRIFDRLRFGPNHSSWRSKLALALGAEQREEALSLVNEELELAKATGLARPYGIALRAAGELSAEDDVDQLRASIELLAESPARLERARSLIALGTALRGRGHRIDAREPLAEGRELAHRCGAYRTMARAAKELRAAGARPRRIARTGIDALTPSERRVAELVADGYSNAELAQELFVSVKTVEAHLSRVYSKLGFSGAAARRRRLREALNGAGA